MCAATALSGLLPPYGALGLAAPPLLLICRLFQGVGAGVVGS